MTLSVVCIRKTGLSKSICVISFVQDTSDSQIHRFECTHGDISGDEELVFNVDRVSVWKGENSGDGL